ncbi:NitT/TauT family transport system substrate-binding protein [Rhodococcus sp. 27YEA15]|uniref:ABC transporter substrate-binding protein n=1 Tax=Rhodococcus sp. 27YEA15 TaxID=3156259 RepID=UPI003C7BFAB4
MIRTIRVSLVAVVASTLALTGCSLSGENNASAEAPEILQVSNPTALSNTSLHYANSSGIFEQHGLTVETRNAQSGAQSLPLLLNGQLHFAAADPVSALTAISQGNPIKIVVGGNVVPADPEADISALLAKDDSSIRSVADLDGTTVAVNALRSFSQLGLQAAIDENGGDSTTVNWIEAGFAQMPDAVERGTVDAAAAAEPFVTAGKDAGLRLVSKGGLSTTMAGVPQVTYIATTDFVNRNPEIVKSFVDSINESNSALGATPELIREVGKTSTDMTPDQLAAVTLPTFGPPLTLDSIAKLETYMVRYGILSAPIENLADHVVVQD